MKTNILSFAKRAAAVSVLAGTLALCGCGKMPFAQRSPSFDSTYTVNAEITFDKLKASAEITRVKDGEWEVRFTEPKQLNGLTVCINRDGFAAYLGGLSISAKNGAVYEMLPKLITEGLSQLIGAGSDALTERDGVTEFTGELNGKRVTITANSETGDLISMKCPFQKLTVNFSGQKPYALTLPEAGGITEE